jgi:hypothetical protein
MHWWHEDVFDAFLASAPLWQRDEDSPLVAASHTIS